MIAMKTFYILLLLIRTGSSHCLSQWTNDPDNPQLVSDVVCTQSAVNHVPDGDGGAFIFWLDSRVSCNEGAKYDIYGQHYNSNGDELWEPGGREILNYAYSIAAFSVLHTESDDELVIGCFTQASSIPDSLRFQKLDDEGNTVWENDLLVARADGCVGNYMLGFENFSFLRDDSGYVVNLSPVYCGGSDGNRITRFNSNGELTGPFNGDPEGNQYYIGQRGIDRTYDGTNDVYLYYADGNGAGAHARCMRVSLQGDTVWAPFDVLAETNGINYQFNALSDDSGIAVFFISYDGDNTGNDLYMRKINVDGSWAWDGNTIVICGAEGGQDDFNVVQDDNYYYVAWSDGRPGLNCGYAAVYAQKIDKQLGQIQWQENGIEVIDDCAYAPSAEVVLTDEGKLMVCNLSTTAATGFNAVLVNPDGSLEWSEPTVMGNSGFNPFYHDYKVIQSGTQTIVAWSKSYSGGGADGIYINNIQAPMTLVYETIEACDSYEFNGTTYTESGEYLVELPGDTLLTLNLTITTVEAEMNWDGTTFTAINEVGFLYWLNCTTNTIELDDSQTFTPDETGEYALIVGINSCQDTTECILVTITGLQEISDNHFISTYPNPFDDSFVLSLSPDLFFQGEKVMLEIFNVVGEKVYENSMLGTNIVISEISVPGAYRVRVTGASHTYTSLVVKE
jgi:hypothetical protein